MPEYGAFRPWQHLMYSAILTLLRMSLGTVISLGLSYFSILVSVLLLDTLFYTVSEVEVPSWAVTFFWFNFIGVAAAVGPLIGWMDEDAPLTIDGKLIFVSLVGAACGSWGGMLYSAAVNAGSVFPDHPVSGAALFAASATANAAATGFALIKQRRRHSASDWSRKAES